MPNYILFRLILEKKLTGDGLVLSFEFIQASSGVLTQRFMFRAIRLIGGNRVILFLA